MNAKDNSNLSAFPIGVDTGLTKREYFAAMAMQGMCADSNITDIDSNSIAAWSVECADALLAALEADHE